MSPNCRSGCGMGSASAVRSTLDCSSIRHQRPIVGGFVARLSPSVAATYDADPLIAYLLRLSNDMAVAAVDVEPPSADDAAASLRATRIRWIVVNRERASAPLLDYVAVAAETGCGGP